MTEIDLNVIITRIYKELSDTNSDINLYLGKVTRVNYDEEVCLVVNTEGECFVYPVTANLDKTKISHDPVNWIAVTPLSGNLTRLTPTSTPVVNLHTYSLETTTVSFLPLSEPNRKSKLVQYIPKELALLT